MPALRTWSRESFLPRRKGTVAVVLAAVLAGCSGGDGSTDGPRRATDELPVSSETSHLALPVDLDSAILLRAVEEEVPRQLWSINRRFERCIPKKKIDILGSRVNVVPKVPCKIEGMVTRGDIRMHGEGREIVFDVPIRARVTARDVGGVIKQETATGTALVQARITLDLAPDWSPRGKVRLHYRWTSPPGIDLLGQRINFTEQADKELRPIMRKLEASLPRRLSKVELRAKVEKLWQSGFTTISLSAENPQAWLRMTPRQPLFDGYSLAGSRIRLKLGVDATTETFVGSKPADPASTPLPAPARSAGDGKLHFFMPVVADYGEIEPIIAKALEKRSRRPFDVPNAGEVEASFAGVTVYATRGGRLAVGMDITAKPLAASLGEIRGRIWLEALPVNEAGSAEVAFEQLVVTGDIDGPGGQLLLKLANSPSVTMAIEEALGQNFASDRERLAGKIAEALAMIRKGDFVFGANIADIETGALKAYGKGLYLPVRATGDAAIEFKPGK